MCKFCDKNNDVMVVNLAEVFKKISDKISTFSKTHMYVVKNIAITLL